MKTYKLDEVKKIIKDQDYRYCSLVNEKKRNIVGSNHAKDKGGAMAKFEEIEKRFQVLPDGIYYVLCQNSFNPKTEPDAYPVMVGNVDLSQKAKEPQVIQHFADNGKVMSYTEALKLTQENARLTAELASCKKELSDLEKEYDELEADYEEATKETPLSEPSPAQNWLQTTIPTLTPILDRFADVWEKKIALDEKKLSVTGGRRVAPQAKPQNGRQLPTPGTPQFEQYLDQLEALDDESFMKECNYLSKFHPDIYVHVYEAFKEDEQTPTNEQTQN